MPQTSKTVRAWLASLDEAFGEIPRFEDLSESECKHEREIQLRGQGFARFIECYQELGLQTLDEIVRNHCPANAVHLSLQVAATRRFRASWVVYNAGYYLDAASSLRPVFEITMFIASVLHGHWDFKRLLDYGHDIDPKRWDHRSFKKTQARHARTVATDVRRVMFGRDSGLDHDDIENIEVLMQVQHMHVHYAESTVIDGLIDLQGGEQLALYPDVNIEKASLYCNTAVLAAWSHMRTFRYLTGPTRLSASWHKRWHAVDDAGREYIARWEKPMRHSFLRFVDRRFTFDEARAVSHLTDN